MTAATRAFLLGPGSIRVAHGDHEHLPWRDLGAGVDTLEGLVGALLRGPWVDPAGGAP